jgi:hypothetical protein
MPRRSRRNIDKVVKGEDNRDILLERELLLTTSPTPEEQKTTKKSTRSPKTRSKNKKDQEFLEDVEMTSAAEMKTPEISLVFSIPSTSGAALTDLAPTSPIEASSATANAPVYAKKSKARPVIHLGTEEKSRWLGYPNRLLNTMKTQEDLEDTNYYPGMKLEQEGLIT